MGVSIQLRLRERRSIPFVVSVLLSQLLSLQHAVFSSFFPLLEAAPSVFVNPRQHLVHGGKETGSELVNISGSENKTATDTPWRKKWRARKQFPIQNSHKGIQGNQERNEKVEEKNGRNCGNLSIGSLESLHRVVALCSLFKGCQVTLANVSRSLFPPWYPYLP